MSAISWVAPPGPEPRAADQAYGDVGLQPWLCVEFRHRVGAVAGSIGGGWLADRLHIRWVLVCMYTLGAIFLYMMTFKTSTTMLYLIVGAVGACSTGAQIVAYAYSGQYYPVAIRSTGIGMASGIGRLGAIVAPVLIGLIVSLNLPLEQNFLDRRRRHCGSLGARLHRPSSVGIGTTRHHRRTNWSAHG